MAGSGFAGAFSFILSPGETVCPPLDWDEAGGGSGRCVAPNPAGVWLVVRGKVADFNELPGRKYNDEV